MRLLRATRVVLGTCCLLLGADLAFAQCVGDCDGDGTISVGELITGVNIALELRDLGDCPGFDRNGNSRVDINELLAAVGAALDACPTPAVTATPTSTSTATSTPTSTATATATASPTPNLPPQVAALPVYRTFPGFDIRLPLPVSDPEGAALTCDLTDLPAGATYDDENASMVWTPADDQLGAFYSPFTCTDDAEPPQPAEGELIFKISPLDACSIPSCDPESGCTATLEETTVSCCGAPPEQRIEEPDADCPGGRVLFIGRNERNGFGRLQNCDLLRMIVLAQSGARLRFNVETRCLNTSTGMAMHARLESASRTPIFDVTTDRIFFFRPRSDGFAERFAIQIPFDGDGPYFDLEDSEANFHVTMTDVDGVSATHSVRVILTSADVPDLPEDEPQGP